MYVLYCWLLRIEKDKFREHVSLHVWVYTFYGICGERSGCFFALWIVGLLFDEGLKGGNSESPERTSLCNHSGVCLSVICVCFF